ncbi:MAG: ABC transporter substrate-binding protein [Pseudomonadota bacterium]
MKSTIVISALLLAVSYLAIRATYPESSSDVPLMYWVTDPAPAREEQISRFHQWLVKHGHIDGDGGPALKLALDVNNNSDQSKLIIQGVSGVASELFDVIGGGEMRLCQQIGLLRDVTDSASDRGFAPSATWQPLEPEISLGGRQYCFPRNAAVRMLWVNTEVFEELGIQAPNRRWTFDEFETIGREFVAKANVEGERQTVFFADSIPIESMHRSLGLSVFNETLTACDLDDPRYVEVLKRLHRWVYEDNLIPTPSQQSSMQGEAVWGGAGPQLFVKGRYGLLFSGRYMVMQYRRMDTPRLAVVELPHGGFPNHRASVAATAVYEGADQPELAELFLAYLASPEYNMQIVESGDALPPLPAYTEQEEFLRPAKYPNEWGCHEVFAQTMNTNAIGGVYSPYILQPVVERMLEDWQQEYDNGLCSPEAAAKETKRSIDLRISQNIERNPALRSQFDAAVERQTLIDQRIKEGRPIPIEWIDNPFYRRYYASIGMIEDDQSGGSLE